MISNLVPFLKLCFIVVVWLPSHVWLFATPFGLEHTGLPVPHRLLEFAKAHAHWISNAIQSSHPVAPNSSYPQSFPASGSFPVSWVVHIRWPKYWSFSFSIGPSNECSRLTSFKINWFDLLAVQGTLESQNYALLALFSIIKEYMSIAKSLSITEKYKDENVNHLIRWLCLGERQKLLVVVFCFFGGGELTFNWEPFNWHRKNIFTAVGWVTLYALPFGEFDP